MLEATMLPHAFCIGLRAAGAAHAGPPACFAWHAFCPCAGVHAPTTRACISLSAFVIVMHENVLVLIQLADHI
jgi:hypothetical protein